jgi:hypothetical protein
MTDRKMQMFMRVNSDGALMDSRRARLLRMKRMSNTISTVDTSSLNYCPLCKNYCHCGLINHVPEKTLVDDQGELERTQQILDDIQLIDA